MFAFSRAASTFLDFDAGSSMEGTKKGIHWLSRLNFFISQEAFPILYSHAARSQRKVSS